MQLPKDSRSRSARRKARNALPPGITRDTLHKLWVRARRGNVSAQHQLRELLAMHPELQAAVGAFEAIVVNGRRHVVPRPEPARGAWVSLVNGGLPGLGKRR